MIQISQYSSEDQRKEKRRNNAGSWTNPEYWYAKTNPNGISLTAAMPIAPVAVLWFPFTPGGRIGSSRSGRSSSGHWD
jgi:hypothetical protein